MSYKDDFMIVQRKEELDEYLISTQESVERMRHWELREVPPFYGGISLMPGVVITFILAFFPRLQFLFIITVILIFVMEKKNSKEKAHKEHVNNINKKYDDQLLEKRNNYLKWKEEFYNDYVRNIKFADDYWLKEKDIFEDAVDEFIDYIKVQSNNLIININVELCDDGYRFCIDGQKRIMTSPRNCKIAIPNVEELSITGHGYKDEFKYLSFLDSFFILADKRLREIYGEKYEIELDRRIKIGAHGRAIILDGVYSETIYEHMLHIYGKMILKKSSENSNKKSNEKIKCPVCGKMISYNPFGCVYCHNDVFKKL